MKKNHNQKSQKILDSILSNMKINQSIKVFSSGDIADIIILGFINPTIYMPDNLNLTVKELRHVLSHEVMHYKKRDLYKKLFMHIMKNIFWWNPLIKVFVKDYYQTFEIQCDLYVVDDYTYEDKLEYLESITKVVIISVNSRNKNYNNMIIQNLTGEREVDLLTQRYDLVLDYKGENIQKSIYKLFNIILCIISLFVFVSSYHVVIQPYYEAPRVDNLEYIEEVDDILILKNEKGEYDFYIDGKYSHTEKSLDKTKYKDVVIYE